MKLCKDTQYNKVKKILTISNRRPNSMYNLGDRFGKTIMIKDICNSFNIDINELKHITIVNCNNAVVHIPTIDRGVQLSCINSYDLIVKSKSTKITKLTLRNINNATVYSKDIVDACLNNAKSLSIDSFTNYVGISEMESSTLNIIRANMVNINCEINNSIIDFLISNIVKCKDEIDTTKYITYSDKKGIGRNFLIYSRYSYICLDTKQEYRLTEDSFSNFIVKEMAYDTSEFAKSVEPLLKILIS